MTVLFDPRDLCEHLNVTQSELARRVGVHHSRVNKAIKQGGITRYTADRWAIA